MTPRSDPLAPLWRYVRRVLKGLDIFANTVLGGIPPETISRRAGRARQAGRPWGCILCRVLDWFERGHCELALRNDPPA